MIRIYEDQGKICIKPVVFLGGDAFKSYLAACTGARFDRDLKCNVTVLTKLAPIVQALTDRGFQLSVDTSVQTALSALVATVNEQVDDTRQRAQEINARLAASGKALYPFQVAGMTWLSSRHAALLADEMGLGKTVQTCMALPDGSPVLIVCPAVAKGVWQRELAKWRPEFRVTVLSGRGSFQWPRAGEAVVVNYDILPSEIPDGVATGTVLVADEVHATKKAKAKRTMAFRAIASAVQKDQGKLWGLTGTPLENAPPELWTVLQGLGLISESFGRWGTFCQTMGGYRGKWGMEWDDPRDSKAVGEMLRRVMLRRLRTEVLPDLPTKTYETVKVAIGKKEKKILDRAEERLGEIEEMAEERDLEMKLSALSSIGEISEARAALAALKIPTMLEIVEAHEENKEPLVVFSAHRAPIDELAKREGWRVITGDTSPEERSQIEDAFQRGELLGVGGTVRAAGVAITLTRSHKLLFVDRDWNPAKNDQAEDRVCRIGQDRGVIVTDLVADHPLDERLYEVLTRKRVLIDATVEQARQIEPAIKTMVVPEFVNHELPPEKASLPRFAPRNAVERWVQSGLMQLAIDGPDRASQENGVGFNKLDNVLGHKMYQEMISRGGKLTDKQWAYAAKFLAKYHRQIGEMPE